MVRLTFSTPLLRATLKPTSTSQFLPRCIANTAASTRFFSQLPSLRPTLQSRTPGTAGVFRAPASNPLFAPAATTTTTETVADVVSKTVVTSHPAFAGGVMQARFGPRPTMSGHSRLIQKRRHGFLSRIRTKNGRKTLQRRKTKGRLRIAC
ncbi:hypothetical protein QBC34DRAFT_406190 [Podospora aff. communis PSN243]|uniref:Mitochondrial LSU ribosomal protein L34 n=1 Tax=Podospora aff. communis PSN243 TaxID=3040156 RepID=A0AAV9GN70_9PEZI|nr:hypothetical protein QBC34DRAFT_406190 [Podospora aff. communis PSN243]